MAQAYLIQLAIFSYSILPAMADNCPQIEVLGQSVGKVTSPDIDEASGLVASQVNKDIFWIFNDRAGPSCIYALKMDGMLVKTNA